MRSSDLARDVSRSGNPARSSDLVSPMKSPAAGTLRTPLWGLCLLGALLLGACGTEAAEELPPGDSKMQDPMKQDPMPMRPALGEPIMAVRDSWTWIDFPEAVCDDGSATGIGINPNPDSKNVLVFLMGGGACWDYLSCAVLNTSTHGPYARAQFEGQKNSLKGTILDRQGKGPFADWNLVFVPYCTGDVHVGDNVMTYDGGLNKRIIRHKGRPNLIAFLKRIAGTVPDAEKLVVSGSSAGGFGAALNYDVFRSYFPSAKSYLLDDSGPPLVGDAIPADHRAAWWKSWHLDATLGTICPECENDFSMLVPILSKKYPSDRMALLSYTEDAVIRNFMGFQSPMQFRMNLLDMTAKRLDDKPLFQYYYMTGESHTFLGNPEKPVVQGVKLSDWIAAFATDAADWKSVKP